MIRVISLIFAILFLVTEFNLASAQVTREKQLIESYQNEKSDSKKFSRLMALAEYYKANNIRKADSIRHIVVDKSITFNDSIRFVALLYNIEVLDYTGNQEEYFNTVLSCQPFLNTLNSESARFKIYLPLAHYHIHYAEYEAADFYLKKALQNAKKKRFYEGQFGVYDLEATKHMQLSQKDSALYYSELAINAARKSGNRELLGKAFNKQAEVYSFFGQVELSVAKNMISLHLAEEVGNKRILAILNREVGQSQQLIFNFEDAEYFYKKSMEYSKQIEDYRQVALAMSSLASIQLKKGEYESATKNAESAIEYLTPLHDYNGLGETHNILGMVYNEQKMYNEASSNFNQALIYFESTNNKEKIASVYHNVGTVFKAQKKYDNALNYLNRSIEIREQYGSKDQIFHTYRTIADVYKEINNKDKALQYMEIYLNYLDSNTTLQAATKIAELSESYRAEQRERLISQQKDSIQRQLQDRALTSTKLENIQLRNSFQTYIIIAFLIIILLAGTIVFFRWNQAKIVQQQNEAEMSQKLLRSQMNPHFVFNAMSVIQSYIFENDTINSSKFLVNFSRLMRLILENSPKELIPIKTEVEILEKYLSMQKLRFQERFEYSIDVQEELYEEFAIIPPMITQPFIENSIEHGQLHTIEGGGFIHISFTKENNMLHINIVDNGIGRKGSKALKKSTAHKSMAMDITKQRIDILNKKFKTEGYLIIEDYDQELETGTKVLISLPYTVDSNPMN